jgi:hypothetical protein
MLAEFDWNALLKKDVLIFLPAILVPIAFAVGWTWIRVVKIQSECDLKRTLAERGLSAEEIERVVAAKGPKDDDD